MAVIERPLVTDVRKTRLKEWGTSRAVRVPKAVCDSVGISAGSDLTMESGTDAAGGFILIRPAASGHRSYADAPLIPMDEAFEGYGGGYAPREADWGPDVGAEVVA